MGMSASTLATQLQNMTPTSVEATANQRFADAWAIYFAASAAGAVAYVSNPAHKSAMISAMTGSSATGQGALKIQQGVVAWWASVLSTFAATYPSAIALVPPVLITGIAALLIPVLTANTAGSLSLASSCTQVATVLHTNNLGGTATLPPAVVTPIL